MSESRAPGALALAVVALVVAGCAASPRAVSTEPAVRAPATEGPTNFASPTDMLQRYPEMRHQQL
jgi:hypothetical protein